MKYPIYIVLLFLVSCDIPGRIEIINKTGASVLYRYEETTSTGEKRVIDIMFNGKKNDATILFGFGQFWTDARIEEYAQGIETIKIITASDTSTMKDQEEIFKFLRNRRSGIFKQVIKIVIK